jgi:hypothetical protein
MMTQFAGGFNMAIGTAALPKPPVDTQDGRLGEPSLQSDERAQGVLVGRFT